MATANGDPQTSLALFKAPECWGLPSISVACIQAEAYIRFTEAPVELIVCDSTSKSPTGQLPALEKDADICSTASDEFGAAKAVIAFARKHVSDLDAWLNLAQKAELLAFTSLIEGRLVNATVVATWCERRGFAEYGKAAYKSSPFPLNYILPFSQQRAVLKKYGHLTPEQVYDEGVEAITAVADRLRTSGGKFFFGSRPTSLDALLYGHLTYYRWSPAAAPVLRDKVINTVALSDFLDAVNAAYFGGSSSARSRAGSSTTSSAAWSDAAQGQKSTSTKREPTAAELEFQRNSWYWLSGAGIAMAAYVLLSGRYIKLSQIAEMLSNADAEDDDEGDED